MRLTLRTLLAYLDDVLEGEEREQLRQQIESSDAAVAWVHRTRDVMGRLRLGAAEPDAAGGAEDANRVAEYLDRVMPEEDVAEFERVCLESDAGLAEVAACHQVLALVLEQSGDVDPDTRRRLVGLRDELAEALQSPTVSAGGVLAEKLAAAASGADDVPPVVTRTVDHADEAEAPPVAPDYLRESDDGGALKSWGPAIAAVVLLAVTALLVADPAGLFREVAKEPVEESTPTPDPAPAPAPEPIEPNDGVTTTPDMGEDATDPGIDPEPIDPPTNGESTELGGDPAVADDGASETTETNESSVNDQAAATGGADPGEESADDEENEPVAPTPWLATFGDRQLVVAETSPDRWRRVSGGETVVEPERVVVPPAYEAAFELGTNVELRVFSDTNLTLVGSDAAEDDAVAPARLEVQHGRILLSCSDQAPQDESLVVRLDGVDYDATLGPGAVMALHVERPYAAGHPVQEVPPSLLAVAHSMVGPVSWTGPRGGAMHAGAESWVAVGDRLAGVPPAFREPTWATDGESLSIADRSAAPRLAAREDLTEPVWQRLMTLSDPEENRLSEVRRLSARVALALGHPEPLVASFVDPEERQQWTDNLATLRMAASRNSASAKAIGDAMRAKYGEQTGDEMVEMLSGYTPDEVGPTAAAVAEGVVAEAIIPRLRSEQLALRVLSSLILDETVVQPSPPYSPLEDRTKRRRALNRITNRLEDSELSPISD